MFEIFFLFRCFCHWLAQGLFQPGQHFLRADLPEATASTSRWVPEGCAAMAGVVSERAIRDRNAERMMTRLRIRGNRPRLQTPLAAIRLRGAERKDVPEAVIPAGAGSGAMTPRFRDSVNLAQAHENTAIIRKRLQKVPRLFTHRPPCEKSHRVFRQRGGSACAAGQQGDSRQA